MQIRATRTMLLKTICAIFAIWVCSLRTESYNRYLIAYRCCAMWTDSDCSNPLCFGKTSCPEGGTCIAPDLCACPPGFLAPKCQDINECSNGNGGCQHICTNTHGSFKCSCSHGYFLAPDSQSCIDSTKTDKIDEKLLFIILVPIIGAAVLLGIVAATVYALKRYTRKVRVWPENEVPHRDLPPRVVGFNLMQHREPSTLPEFYQADERQQMNARDRSSSLSEETAENTEAVGKCDVISGNGPYGGKNIIGPDQTPRMMRGV